MPQEPTLVSVDVFVSLVNYDIDLTNPTTDDRLPKVKFVLWQAEQYVMNYVTPVDPAWTDQTVPGEVTSAICLIAQSLLDDSKSATMLHGLDTDETNPVRVLLRKWRTPTLA